MGKKQQWNQLYSLLQQQIAQANQPSPYETQMNQQWQNTNNWLNAKDYRNMPAGVNVDLLPLADYQKMRKMMRGDARGGTHAAGVMNNNILQQQRELDDNQFVQDWGGAYEQKVGELQNRSDALGAGLQGMYQNRQGMGLQGIGLGFKSLQSKPSSMWSQLLPSLISGGAQVGAAFI